MYTEALPWKKDGITPDDHSLMPLTALNIGRPRLVGPKCCCSPERQSTRFPLARGDSLSGQPIPTSTQTAARGRPGGREYMHNTLNHVDSTQVTACACLSSGGSGPSMQFTHSRSNTTRLPQKFTAILKRMRLRGSCGDTPITGATLGCHVELFISNPKTPMLPEIDTGPSIRKVLLPDEQSLSEMRLPPIEPMDPTIHISSLPEEAEERHESSENDAGEFNAISVISRVPSCGTHAHSVDVGNRAGTVDIAGYRLSTGSGASATSFLSSGGLHHCDGNTNDAGNQWRPSPPLLPEARSLTSTPAEMPAQPTSENRQNHADLPSVSAFKRIRQLLVPGGNRLPVSQRAVWIAPAQCTQQIVVTPIGGQCQPRPPSGEYVPFPDDGQSTITTSEDGAKGCCSLFITT